MWLLYSAYIWHQKGKMLWIIGIDCFICFNISVFKKSYYSFQEENNYKQQIKSKSVLDLFCLLWDWNNMQKVVSYWDREF